MDLKQHLTRQMVFSKATFGPGERDVGVCDHIVSELSEVLEARTQSHLEWVDVVILSLDGLTRRLWANAPEGTTADEIAEVACALIVAKQDKNELRTWPDWRTAEPGKAIEHIRGSHD